MPKNQPFDDADPLTQLATIAESYDSKVRLLFQLRNYISLVKYNPEVAKKDKTAEFRRFVTANKLSLWDKLEAKSDTRKTFKRLQTTRKEVEDVQSNLSVASQHVKTAPEENGSKSKAAKTKSKQVGAQPAAPAHSPAASKTSRAQRHALAGSKRKSTHEHEEGEDSPNVWNIDSDLGWPDDLVAPPSSKRAKRPRLIASPGHHIKPAFGGDLDAFLSSYKTISDDQEPISREQWDKKVLVDAEALQRVSSARDSGLLAELESYGVGSGQQIAMFTPPPPTEASYYDNLMGHAVHYAKLRSNLRKFHQTIIKRNSQSVEQYFRRLAGAEDRERKEMERQIRQIARRTGQEVMRKWKLAQKIVEQRREAALAEEKREKGKEYLNQILDNSAKLIESQAGEISRPKSEDDNISGGDDNDESEEVDESDDDDDDQEDDADAIRYRGGEGDMNDAQLSLEELREKYKDMPEIGSDIGTDVDEEAAEDASESDGNGEDEAEVPSEEALRLYADTKEADESSESHTESESGSGSESESADSDSESETERPGLAALLGGDLHDDPEEVGDDESADAESQDGSSENDDLQPAETALERIPSADSDSEPNSELPPEIEKEITEGDSKTPPPEESDVTRHHKVDPPPFLLKGHLREYQRNGLDWLAGLVQSGTNGILADEMGLGKTIQTIGLLAWLACEKHIWGPHLIVVPTSVMLNWEMEFKRFAPGFKILTYFGTPQQRKRKRRGWNKEDTWHVCITSYQLVIQDQVVFRGKRWQYMVLDEAHNIKNFRSQRWQALLNFNAQHRLLLTGTPLQNNLVELWSLLYFLMPSTRATQMMPAGFANLDDFQEWFAKPVDQMVEEGDEADDEARKTISKLHQVLRPYLLRRLKADVEKQMPAKYEHVVYCRLSKRQRYLYDDFMSRASTKATLASGNFMSILNCLMQLRKVCNHPDLFEVRPIVTSYTIDKGVYSSFGSNVAPKFDCGLTKNMSAQLDSLNLVFPHMESDPKWVGLTRNRLSASSIMQEEIDELQKEVSELESEDPDLTTVEGWAKHNLFRRRLQRLSINKRMLALNNLRTSRIPVYGEGCLETLRIFTGPVKGVLTALEREESMRPIIDRYVFVTPPAVVLDYPEAMLGSQIANTIYSDEQFEPVRGNGLFHEAQVKSSIAFPDKRLVQYDCGKLQKLAVLLRDLILNGHRCLIFTQMTRVLDVLELFLNLHGWRYLRLDGATRIEQRQALTERFNKDANIPVFILSTRSGGLGINLTGADTVIFYDSDWNPAMDRQCQDRCHRIGQTRDVHIYRLVSEYTIESNILRKATQKTILDNVVIQEGDFTTEYFTRMSVQDILGNDAGRNTSAPTLEELESSSHKQIEVAMAQAEDRDDQLAANLAMSEARMDQEEFEESRQLRQSKTPEPSSETEAAVGSSSHNTPTPQDIAANEDALSERQAREGSPTSETDLREVERRDIETPDNGHFETGQHEIDQPEIGHIDDWMIHAIERGYIY